MDSLVGYGSDDEVDDRYGNYQQSLVVSGASSGAPRRRDDDTNYDDVNMDMSEESQGGESEPELPQAEETRHERREERAKNAAAEPRREDRSDRRGRRDSPRRDRERERRSPRRDERSRSDRSDRGSKSVSDREGGSKRGLLGDRPDDRQSDNKVPALMELKPFGEAPPDRAHEQKKSHDARDAVSPRFTERDRRDRDRERDRDRDRRHTRRSEERRSGGKERSFPERRERSRSRGAAFPPPAHTHTNSHPPTTSERRHSPSDYRPSSYKVNKKLEVMEKMGLQIKTPDGSMATARQLRAAAGEPQPAHAALPDYYNPCAVNTNKVLDQVQKRKLLWSNKSKSEAEEAAKWSGARFSQDSDGRQVSKFMRLMGIKEPAAVKPEQSQANVDPIKKQEELFQAMQAQYEVARATTHTMRGVGLGFQRGQF